ncbi:hypothetical protein BDV18DRAFT_156048 [Aspergillus unguis]
MDLSSLEGPPITDARFGTPASSAARVPHIRLDTTFSPVSPLDSNAWALPPRPASTSAISHRSKYNNSPSNGDRQPSTERRFRSPPNQSLNSSVSRGVSHFATTTTLSHIPRSRPHSTSESTPHQLVWVESEQIWILTSRTTTPTSEQRPRSANAMHGSTRSRNLHPLAGFFGEPEPEPEDLPPPYEQHIFDQPLGAVQPAVSRLRPQEAPRRESRWTAIGRRVS